MDTTPQVPTVVRNLSLEERAVSNSTYTYFLDVALMLQILKLVLAMAVNIDFDYFSRHSNGG